ncbi:toll-like receptor Tollo [Aphidius gifuensis]|uniref:toll-like receptor Tollo n=1 Tax=Aphidius gifuensis TaxID=684658 RepID=UPI001CDCCE33|nr:toll-like receptor Tollo [Aphidius gifuensis]
MSATKMQGNPVFLAILLGMIFYSFGVSLSNALKYKAPDECKWIASDNNKDDISLVCHLRTINSELENTNFNVIQPQHTVRLRLECSDALFYQSSLSAGSFKPLIELRELIIEYCKITNLSDDAFKGLRELRNLTVRTHNTDWSAMALDVSAGAFTNELSKLETLDLGENNMWNFPERSLCSLENLKILNLTKNRLREISSFHFNTGTQQCSTNLKEVDFSNNNIEILPAAIFSALSKLQILNLCSNKIIFIADRAFEGLSSINVLKLANNQLTSLPPDLFNDSRNIKEIDLKNNSLNVLPPGLFNDLMQLMILDLSMNELSNEWINTATFTGLVRLVVLNLSSNKIRKLESTIFRDLFSLQTLQLEKNLIESLTENTFSSLNNLHTLVLSDNQLTVIDANSLSGLYVLSLLSLDNNRLRALHPNSLQNVSSLQDLHLNGNQLTVVPNALRATPFLRTLDLGENLISDIPSGIFDHMTQLYGLRFTENHLVNLTKDIFDKIKELKILNLSRNKIQSIESGAFDGNKNIQAVRLDGNQLSDITGLFSNLPNLVWLNVSDNKLKWFDYAMIPTGLQWLDIHLNEISELGNYFEIETQLQLSMFDASENKLTEITGNSIPMSVEELFLNDNHILKVHSYSFFKKPNLTRVDLKGNKIQSLEAYALRISVVPENKPLPEFYIGDNNYLCDCTMEWLQQVNKQNQSRIHPRVMDLESIYCRLLYDRERMYVPLVEASHSQFLCKYESHCFALCHCCDFDACDCEMTCPNNCTCYHDQSWSANLVDCSDGNHNYQLPKQIPMDATKLYLDGNDLRIISSHAFIGRKKLRVLFLNASNIEMVQNRSFNGLRDLQNLHLEENKIRELRGHEFEGLDTLKILCLQKNKISVIENNTFVPLYSLKYLYLQNNYLTTFQVWVLPETINVALANNPWSCDCGYLEEYRQWIFAEKNHVIDQFEIRCLFNLTNFEVYGEKIFNDFKYVSRVIHDKSNDNITCMGITNIKNRNTISGNLTKTIIEKQLFEDYLPLLVSNLTVFLLILLFCVLIFIFWHEFRVWFHSKFGVRIFYRNTEFEREDREKLFDAFVSYSSKDEAFVIEELAPVLELGNPSYKLCLHYRDFPVGDFIADTIVQAVESSKRTIIVLSENFIKSEWCRFDFKSAHHQVLRDRRRRLILVIVGDVPQGDLDPDIRLYLKTNTYLQWGDKLFWEKLRFALPDKPNNSRIEHQLSSPVHRQYHNSTSSTRNVAVHM